MVNGNPEDRAEFLLKMYDAAWGNITRTDDVIWKLYTSYTALVIGSVALSTSFLARPFFGIVATLLITFVAVLHSVNVNAWFLRNIVMIGNIEEVFLNDADYGTVIPSTWRPRYRPAGLTFWNLDELPMRLAILYAIGSALIVWAYWKRMTHNEQHITLIYGAVLAVLLCRYVLRRRTRFNRLVTGAPGLGTRQHATQ